MASFHDRMPVILPSERIGPWLDGTLGADAIEPVAENAQQEWTVSARVNKAGAGDDDPESIAPAAAVSGS